MSHPCPHWYRIMFSNGKTHTCPGSLHRDLITEMAERGCALNEAFETWANGDPGWRAVRPVRDGGLDVGCMGYVDEPYVGFRLHNLTLDFLCSSVQHFYLAAKSYTERRFASGRPYFKHHGRLHCLVFTPSQHRLFLAKMAALVPVAEATAHEFFAGKQSPIQVLRDGQAKLRGVNPEALGPVADFGASDADRFTNAVRGES